MLYRVRKFFLYSNLIATNGRSHLMLNTIKRDERRAEKILFKKLLTEHDKMKNMKEDIAKLKDELKRCQIDKEEADKNKDILASLYDKQIIDAYGNLN